MQARLAVVLALLLILAGCVDGPSASSPADTTTGAKTTPTTSVATASSSTTTTATTTPTTKTDANSLHESPVFDYEDLSAESRADFDRVLDRGTVEVSEPLFAPRIADAHYNVIRVRYDGRIVEIRHQRQQSETRTCLEGVTRVNESRLGDGSTVRAYANLSEAGASLFRAALDGNASDPCYPPSEYPFDAGYVRYQGQLYALSELHGSTTIYVYRVRTD